VRVYQFRHIRRDGQCSRAAPDGPARHGVPGHLDSGRFAKHQFVFVEPRFDEHDLAAIPGGIFDANAKLEGIRIEVQAIRILLENGDEEEAEEDGDDES